MCTTFKPRAKISHTPAKQEQTITEKVSPLLELYCGMLSQTIWKRSVLYISLNMSISPSKRNKFIDSKIFRDFYYCGFQSIYPSTYLSIYLSIYQYNVAIQARTTKASVSLSRRIQKKNSSDAHLLQQTTFIENSEINRMKAPKFHHIYIYIEIDR